MVSFQLYVMCDALPLADPWARPATITAHTPLVALAVAQACSQMKELLSSSCASTSKRSLTASETKVCMIPADVVSQQARLALPSLQNHSELLGSQLF